MNRPTPVCHPSMCSRQDCRERAVCHLVELHDALADPAYGEFDLGPWHVSEDGRMVFSEDATHKVNLQVHGEFFNDAQRKRYASRLAERLNAFADEVDVVGGSVASTVSVNLAVQAIREAHGLNVSSADRIGRAERPSGPAEREDDANRDPNSSDPDEIDGSNTVESIHSIDSYFGQGGRQGGHEA